MRVTSVYNRYFNGFNEAVKTNVLTSFKVLSFYFISVVRLAFATADGATSLYGRMTKKENNEAPIILNFRGKHYDGTGFIKEAEDYARHSSSSIAYQVILEWSIKTIFKNIIFQDCPEAYIAGLRKSSAHNDIMRQNVLHFFEKVVFPSLEFTESK